MKVIVSIGGSVLVPDLESGRVGQRVTVVGTEATALMDAFGVGEVEGGRNDAECAELLALKAFTD